MYLTRLFLIVVAVFSCLSGSAAQALRGIITDEEGQPLPFATVYVPELRRGTASNAEGEYMLLLTPGTHSVRFQYIGYGTVTGKIEIRDQDVVFDVRMQTEPVQLREVTVHVGREDPAYTIMRKAIAKAGYHAQQLDAYTTTVYIKGTGRLRGLPGLFRKRVERELEKEGIDTTTAFTMESVSEISYRRPNQYEEKVISIRTVGDDMNTSPIGYIQSSFYEPQVNNSVSPLSPRAFAYYRFEYLGDFEDQGYTINKIRVTPRSRGDNVFEGVIYIVDQLWCIHSLDLDTYIWGIKFNINQIYQPVADAVWLPLNHIFDVTGAFFGFRFEFRYFANMSDYDITLNRDLVFIPEVIDDRLEPELARSADAVVQEKLEDATLQELATGQEVSRRQLRRLLREYEREEQKTWAQDTMQDVVHVFHHSVDSMAYRRDSVYWTRIRPVPLTEFEVRGYRVQDSLAAVRAAEKTKQDSVILETGSENGIIVRSHSRFQPQHLILGGSYRLSDGARLAIDPVIGNMSFNTVDGYHAAYGVRFYQGRSAPFQWSVAPSVRYAFSRKAVNYRMVTSLSKGTAERRNTFRAEGGKYISQLNPQNPIDPGVNALMSLLFRYNYMKIYEKEYVDLRWNHRVSRKFNFSVGAAWQRNDQLENFSNYSLLDEKKRVYSSNVPYNAEFGETDFPAHQSSVISMHAEAQPWLRYRIRNNRKSVIEGSSPTLRMQYKMGVPGLLGSNVGFYQIEAGVRHTVSFAGGGLLNFNINGGTFLGGGTVYFPQFKHFAGNRTPFVTLDPAASFRMLDYYTYSTREQYLTLHTNYQFRKLLATQIFEVRLLGIKESLFFNALETPASDHYFELGYGLNHIFRIFRLELVTAWQDFRYQNFAVRIGIAANLSNVFR